MWGVAKKATMKVGCTMKDTQGKKELFHGLRVMSRMYDVYMVPCVPKATSKGMQYAYTIMDRILK